MSELSPYEIAFLCGGPRRVAETALLALVERRRLRVSRGTHRVDALQGEPGGAVRGEPDDAVQAALLGRIPRAGTLLGPLLAATAESPEVRSLADALRADGLLPGRVRGAVLGTARPTREGRAVRRRLVASPGTGDVARLAALGPVGVEDARMREILRTGDPKPVRLPRDRHRGANLESSGLSDSQYGGY